MFSISSISTYTWTDSNSYQFMVLQVTGLPDINTEYSKIIELSFLIRPTSFHLAAGSVFRRLWLCSLISKDQTFAPVMVPKEVVYDNPAASIRYNIPVFPDR